jgi:putative transposase
MATRPRAAQVRQDRTFKGRQFTAEVILWARLAKGSVFGSAKMVTGVTPDRVATDGHDSYPRAIRTVLGKGVRHRDSQYLNNWLEQNHRGVKGRYGPMRGFKCPRSAGRFCRAYDELRNFLRSRTNQQVSAGYRRFHFLRRTATVLRVLQAA